MDAKNTRRGETQDFPPRHIWRVAVGALLGLLAAIMVVGLVGLLVNRDIRNAAVDALKYDVELEDHGDDLRVATLEVRQRQRTLFFEDENEDAERIEADIAALRRSYGLLEKEIDEYEALEVREKDIASPAEIRALASRYYSDYARAIKRFDATGDRSGWEAANGVALQRLDRIQRLAAEVDGVGERLSEDSLSRVDREARAGMVAISTVLVGLLLVGTMLSYATYRVFNELRMLYRNQRVAAGRLAAASQAKTDFLADVSHELRTPLTVVRGNAEVGLQLQQDATQREILQEILTASDNMSRMVEDLLFLSRSDSSSLPLERRPVEVEPLLSGIAARASVLAKKRGATLETEMRAKGVFTLDEGRLEQAILALVDNAAKYAGGEGPVILATDGDGSHLSVEVRDSGPGVPENELDKVFDRFYRLDKTRSRKLGGTGLGLPIARTIVEAHGGTIRASSPPGGGTVVYIEIPRPSTP